MTLAEVRAKLLEPVSPPEQFGNGAYIRALIERFEFATKVAVAALDASKAFGVSPGAELFDMPSAEPTGSKPSAEGEVPVLQEGARSTSSEVGQETSARRPRSSTGALQSGEPTDGNLAHNQTLAGATPVPGTNSHHCEPMYFYKFVYDERAKQWVRCPICSPMET